MCPPRVEALAAEQESPLSGSTMPAIHQRRRRRRLCPMPARTRSRQAFCATCSHPLRQWLSNIACRTGDGKCSRRRSYATGSHQNGPLRSTRPARPPHRRVRRSRSGQPARGRAPPRRRKPRGRPECRAGRGPRPIPTRRRRDSSPTDSPASERVTRQPGPQRRAQPGPAPAVPRPLLGHVGVVTQGRDL